MTKINVRTAAGKKAGSVELPADVFDVTVNVPLIHQVVVAQLAAARRAHTAPNPGARSPAAGASPTARRAPAERGRARPAPQFAGGGVVHGPTPRDYAQRTPKKMKAAALRGALSDRARHGHVHVVTGFVDGDTPSTKSALAVLGSITESRQVLVVAARGDDVTVKSLRNAPQVHLLTPDQLNTYDVLCADDVVFTRTALEAFLARSTADAAAEDTNESDVETTEEVAE